MYYNELKYELEKNSEIIKQRDDIFRDIVRHEEHLNEEHLNKGYKYEKKIKELKNNLSHEKKAKKKKKRKNI